MVSLVLLPPVLALLAAVDLEPGPVGFVAYSAALAVGLGALVTPMVAVRAMTDDVDTDPRAAAPGRSEGGPSR